MTFSSSAGVIDLNPVRQVKESRNLDTETADIEEIDTPKLLEVTEVEAPNVLTNDPTFFTSKKNSTLGNNHVNQKDR